MNDYNERSIWLRLRATLSMNDPRWGRGDGNGSGGSNGERQRANESKRPQNGKDGEGPPDLDEMWRDFNRRLSRVFGRKGGGGPGRSDNGRGARIGVGLLIGALIAIYLGTGVYNVQDGQAAVVMQFGQYRYTAGPGMHWRLPYPFEAHELVNVGAIHQVQIGRDNVVRLANVKDAAMLTQDADIVDVRFDVQYQVRKPTDYLFRSTDPDLSVTQAAQAAVRTIVGTRSTDSILFQDREAIRQQLVTAIQHDLDAYQSGLAVTGVTIRAVQVPDEVQTAYDAAAKARQDNDRAKQEADAYAAQLLPRAQADATRMIDEAKTYSDKTVAQAQGDAERFKQVYAQYSKAPAVIRERMYLDTMQQIYSNTTKVFVDSKSGNNVIYLPLDKLVEQTRQRVADAAASGVAAGGAPAVSPSAGVGGSAGFASPSSASVPPATDAGTLASAPTATAPAASAPVAAASPASQPAASSDALRSRDSFRSRMREDDVQ